MSYSILAVGSKAEATAQVTKLADANASPEMPQIKAFLLGIIESVEGDDKRVAIDANGWHSGGNVSHNISVRSTAVPTEGT